MSVRCVEMIYEWRYLLIVRFRHLSHTLMHLAAYRHVYLVACNSMRATACLSSGTGSLRYIFCLSRRNMHVRSDTTVDPMCVQAANALVRLCICTGSSELTVFATGTCHKLFS